MLPRYLCLEENDGLQTGAKCYFDLVFLCSRTNLSINYDQMKKMNWTFASAQFIG